jgi:hypothetical protein
MRGFRDPQRTQALLSNFGPIRQHFALNDICWAHLSIANRTQRGSPHGGNLATSPKLRRSVSEPQVRYASSSTTCAS